MYKVLLVIVLAAACFMMYAVQLDQEAAVQVFFELKRATNRAAHAAASQVDLGGLADGHILFDEAAAWLAAEQYLRSNLNLDERLAAEEDSSLRGQVEIQVFELIDSTYTFPYRYEHEAYDYAVTLDRPGVILIIHAEYNRLFNVLRPISWHVKSAAEIVR